MATDLGTREEANQEERSPPFHSFTCSLTLSAPSVNPLGHTHSRAFQPMAAKSLHTLKPLTSNQPWRPNRVLYGRHWANAPCTRDSHPSPPFYIPSVPAAIWLTPHQYPNSPTHISPHNRHAYAQAHTLSRALGASIESDKGVIDSFVMSIKHHPQTLCLSHLSQSHVIDF